ncbi:DUF2059 domain-containing protein [Ferrimonas sp. YFM]|uniref:DUF2059 domain-containing protein n=1 Tax=Ferrimonas sp. YFM TaxID=3028878 RepID=UPI002573340B|nr:DUF2059 domain-containing protein [Ferrimonas sp. YFM]BDY04867.1 hypothetical protein F0521_19080 [Ferrimonas sp. YFM]
MSRALFTSLLAVVLLTALPVWANSHLQVAYEMLEAMGAERLTNESLEVVLDHQVRANSEMEPFRQTLKVFYFKHAGWDSVKEDYAALYQEAFSEEELRQLTEFYRTQVGQKMLRLQPQLMEEAMMIGERRLDENIQELQQMVREREEFLSRSH